MKFTEDTEFEMLCEVETAVKDAYCDYVEPCCRIFLVNVSRALETPVQDLVKITMDTIGFMDDEGEIREDIKYDHRGTEIWPNVDPAYQYLISLGMHVTDLNPYRKEFTFCLDLKNYRDSEELNERMSRVFERLNEILISDLLEKEHQIDEQINKKREEERKLEEEIISKHTLVL